MPRLLGELEFVQILVNVEETLQVPKSVVCLLLAGGCSYSSFAADDVAPGVNQELPSLIRTSRLSALILPSIVYHLELFEEELGPVFNILVWNGCLTFLVGTDAANDALDVLLGMEDFREVIRLITEWALNLQVGYRPILQLLGCLGFQDWVGDIFGVVSSFRIDI